MTATPLTMTKAQIKDSIANWDSIRPDNEKLIEYLGQGNSFNYKFPKHKLPSDAVHAYPAIYLDKLVFLLIPSAYDSEEYDATIADYVKVCPVLQGMSSNRIPPSVAKERIKLWKDDHVTWIPQQTATDEGIFKAFKIDSEDFETKDSKVSLALKLGDELGSLPIADMVVTNPEESAVYYDDFAQPVPPYGSFAAMTSFHLLHL